MKKFICIAIASLMLFTSMTFMAGCNFNKGDVIEIDEDKTQLYVMNFDGGFGSKWLDDVAKKFEEMHVNDSYEQGKKGVQIVPNNIKTLAAEAEKSIMEATDEIFFTQNFSMLFDYIAKDYLLDITDIIVEKIPGENRSIQDKMTKEQKEILSVDFTNSGNEKYYAVPHYSVCTGIIYDIDLWENQGLYILSDGTYSIPGAFLEGNYIGGQALSNGPDGKANTYDDGLPATYEEFFELCDYMVKHKSIMPFNWLGKGSTWYLSDMLLSMQADYEGVEQMQLNYTLNGTAKNLVSVSASGDVTKLPELLINENNGYELGAQAGFYYGMDFVEKMVKGSGYHNTTKTGSLTYTHMQAQSDYLYSSYRNSPIAMLVEGMWWENEASDTFTAMEQLGLGKMERRFGLLPFPKATEEQVGEGFTLFDPKMAYGVISKATPSYKHELAKEFLQFCYTDENLAAFSVATNSFRDLDYTLTTEQVAQLSGFGRSLYELKASGQLTIAYALSDSVKFLDNQTAISNMMAKVYWNKASCYATEQLLNGVSAIDLFNTSKSYRQSMWSSLN